MTEVLKIKEGTWKSDEYGFVWCGGSWKCRPEIENFFKQKREPIPIQFRYWESEWTGGPLGVEVLEMPKLVSVSSVKTAPSEQLYPPVKKRGRPKKDLKK
tara:strand:- start:5607 stop:5906 length:300 start_codon:yes stop_codon:yes gene_type:complete